MWIEQDKILHVNGFIAGEFRNDLFQLSRSSKSITASHFNNISITERKEYLSNELYLGPEKIINAIVAKEDTDIIVNGTTYSLLAWQLFAFTGDFIVSYSKDKVYIFQFPYSEKTVYGNGSHKYTVKALIRDEYIIDIMADSKEHAIEQANRIEIFNWSHPDIDPHLKERKLIRYARWGNFEVEGPK